MLRSIGKDSTSGFHLRFKRYMGVVKVPEEQVVSIDVENGITPVILRWLYPGHSGRSYNGNGGYKRHN